MYVIVYVIVIARTDKLEQIDSSTQLNWNPALIKATAHRDLNVFL